MDKLVVKATQHVQLLLTKLEHKHATTTDTNPTTTNSNNTQTATNDIRPTSPISSGDLQYINMFKSILQQLQHPRCTVSHVANAYRNIGLYFLSKHLFREAISTLSNAIQLFAAALKSTPDIRPNISPTISFSTSITHKPLSTISLSSGNFHKSSLYTGEAKQDTIHLSPFEILQKRYLNTYQLLIKSFISLSRIDNEPTNSKKWLQMAIEKSDEFLQILTKARIKYETCEIFQEYYFLYLQKMRYFTENNHYFYQYFPTLQQNDQQHQHQHQQQQSDFSLLYQAMDMVEMNITSATCPMSQNISQNNIPFEYDYHLCYFIDSIYSLAPYHSQQQQVFSLFMQLYSLFITTKVEMISCKARMLLLDREIAVDTASLVSPITDYVETKYQPNAFYSQLTDLMDNILSIYSDPIYTIGSKYHRTIDFYQSIDTLRQYYFQQYDTASIKLPLTYWQCCHSELKSSSIMLQQQIGIIISYSKYLQTPLITIQLLWKAIRFFFISEYQELYSFWLTTSQDEDLYEDRNSDGSNDNIQFNMTDDDGRDRVGVRTNKSTSLHKLQENILHQSLYKCLYHILTPTQNNTQNNENFDIYSLSDASYDIKSTDFYSSSVSLEYSSGYTFLTNLMIDLSKELHDFGQKTYATAVSVVIATIISKIYTIDIYNQDTIVQALPDFMLNQIQKVEQLDISTYIYHNFRFFISFLYREKAQKRINTEGTKDMTQFVIYSHMKHALINLAENREKLDEEYKIDHKVAATTSSEQHFNTISSTNSHMHDLIYPERLFYGECEGIDALVSSQKQTYIISSFFHLILLHILEYQEADLGNVGENPDKNVDENAVLGNIGNPTLTKTNNTATSTKETTSTNNQTDINPQQTNTDDLESLGSMPLKNEQENVTISCIRSKFLLTLVPIILEFANIDKNIFRLLLRDVNSMELLLKQDDHHQIEQQATGQIELHQQDVSLETQNAVDTIQQFFHSMSTNVHTLIIGANLPINVSSYKQNYDHLYQLQHIWSVKSHIYHTITQKYHHLFDRDVDEIKYLEKTTEQHIGLEEMNTKSKNQGVETYSDVCKYAQNMDADTFQSYNTVIYLAKSCLQVCTQLFTSMAQSSCSMYRTTEITEVTLGVPQTQTQTQTQTLTSDSLDSTTNSTPNNTVSGPSWSVNPVYGSIWTSVLFDLSSTIQKTKQQTLQTQTQAQFHAKIQTQSQTGETNTQQRSTQRNAQRKARHIEYIGLLYDQCINLKLSNLWKISSQLHSVLSFLIVVSDKYHLIDQTTYFLQESLQISRVLHVPQLYLKTKIQECEIQLKKDNYNLIVEIIEEIYDIHASPQTEMPINHSLNTLRIPYIFSNIQKYVKYTHLTSPIANPSSIELFHLLYSPVYATFLQLQLKIVGKYLLPNFSKIFHHYNLQDSNELSTNTQDITPPESNSNSVYSSQNYQQTCFNFQEISSKIDNFIQKHTLAILQNKNLITSLQLHPNPSSHNGISNVDSNIMNVQYDTLKLIDSSDCVTLPTCIHTLLKDVFVPIRNYIYQNTPTFLMISVLDSTMTTSFLDGSSSNFDKNIYLSTTSNELSSLYFDYEHVYSNMHVVILKELLSQPKQIQQNKQDKHFYLPTDIHLSQHNSRPAHHSPSLSSPLTLFPSSTVFSTSLLHLVDDITDSTSVEHIIHIQSQLYNSYILQLSITKDVSAIAKVYQSFSTMLLEIATFQINSSQGNQICDPLPYLYQSLYLASLSWNILTSFDCIDILQSRDILHLLESIVKRVEYAMNEMSEMDDTSILTILLEQLKNSTFFSITNANAHTSTDIDTNIIQMTQMTSDSMSMVPSFRSNRLALISQLRRLSQAESNSYTSSRLSPSSFSSFPPSLSTAYNSHKTNVHTMTELRNLFSLLSFGISSRIERMFYLDSSFMQTYELIERLFHNYKEQDKNMDDFIQKRTKYQLQLDYIDQKLQSLSQIKENASTTHTNTQNIAKLEGKKRQFVQGIDSLTAKIQPLTTVLAKIVQKIQYYIDKLCQVTSSKQNVEFQESIFQEISHMKEYYTVKEGIPPLTSFVSIKLQPQVHVQVQVREVGYKKQMGNATMTSNILQNHLHYDSYQEDHQLSTSLSQYKAIQTLFDRIPNQPLFLNRLWDIAFTIHQRQDKSRKMQKFQASNRLLDSFKMISTARFSRCSCSSTEDCKYHKPQGYHQDISDTSPEFVSSPFVDVPNKSHLQNLSNSTILELPFRYDSVLHTSFLHTSIKSEIENRLCLSLNNFNNNNHTKISMQDDIGIDIDNIDTISLDNNVDGDVGLTIDDINLNIDQNTKQLPSFTTSTTSTTSTAPSPAMKHENLSTIHEFQQIYQLLFHTTFNTSSSPRSFDSSQNSGKLDNTTQHNPGADIDTNKFNSLPYNPLTLHQYLLQMNTISHEMAQNVGNTTKEKQDWWKMRFELESSFRNNIITMESMLYGPWSGILVGESLHRRAYNMIYTQSAIIGRKIAELRDFLQNISIIPAMVAQTTEKTTINSLGKENVGIEEKNIKMTDVNHTINMKETRTNISNMFMFLYKTIIFSPIYADFAHGIDIHAEIKDNEATKNKTISILDSNNTNHGLYDANEVHEAHNTSDRDAQDVYDDLTTIVSVKSQLSTLLSKYKQWQQKIDMLKTKSQSIVNAKIEEYIFQRDIIANKITTIVYSLAFIPYIPPTLPTPVKDCRNTHEQSQKGTKNTQNSPNSPRNTANNGYNAKTATRSNKSISTHHLSYTSSIGADSHIIPTYSFHGAMLYLLGISKSPLLTHEETNEMYKILYTTLDYLDQVDGKLSLNSSQTTPHIVSSHPSLQPTPSTSIFMDVLNISTSAFSTSSTVKNPILGTIFEYSSSLLSRDTHFETKSPLNVSSQDDLLVTKISPSDLHQRGIVPTSTRFSSLLSDIFEMIWNSIQTLRHNWSNIQTQKKHTGYAGTAGTENSIRDSNTMGDGIDINATLTQPLAQTPDQLIAKPQSSFQFAPVLLLPCDSLSSIPFESFPVTRPIEIFIPPPFPSDECSKGDSENNNNNNNNNNNADDNDDTNRNKNNPSLPSLVDVENVLNTERSNSLSPKQASSDSVQASLLKSRVYILFNILRTRSQRISRIHNFHIAYSSFASYSYQEQDEEGKNNLQVQNRNQDRNLDLPLALPLDPNLSHKSATTTTTSVINHDLSTPMFTELYARHTPSISILRGGYGIVDPNQDLPSTVQRLQPMVAELQKKSWNFTIQKVPSNQDLVSNLTKYSIFVFSGHNGGEQYWGHDIISQLQHHKPVWLMGCSSGTLRYPWQTQAQSQTQTLTQTQTQTQAQTQTLANVSSILPQNIPLTTTSPEITSQSIKYNKTGIAISHLISGSPSVVTNLWAVTDGDIDRVSIELLEIITGTSLDMLSSKNQEKNHEKEQEKLHQTSLDLQTISSLSNDVVQSAQSAQKIRDDRRKAKYKQFLQRRYRCALFQQPKYPLATPWKNRTFLSLCIKKPHLALYMNRYSRILSQDSTIVSTTAPLPTPSTTSNTQDYPPPPSTIATTLGNYKIGHFGTQRTISSSNTTSQLDPSKQQYYSHDLLQAINVTRETCRMPYLNGAALITYGIPIRLDLPYKMDSSGVNSNAVNINASSNSNLTDMD